ncbi:hypothetical protein L6452_43175 [Arctium lappa]|uniref:Uncharacterized protein n=1 Tax=Arctium lappa TaxID=4217 RepID=A0ACB8XM36_ARCLA|nr:hypothetical protein L6452_43175 [Arctium lappa]
MIHLQYEIEMNTKAGLRAQQRWKQAYIAISISNKLLAALKKKKSHHLLMIIPEATTNHDHHGFSSIDKAKITDLVKSKDLELLRDFNGVQGLADALQTNLEDGISSQDAERRKNVFGSNTSLSLPKAFSSFLVEAFKDTTKLLQLVFTAISLGFMIKQERSKQAWNDVGSIFEAVVIIALSALAKFIQARQFHQLSKKLNKIIRIDVLRDRGRRQTISIFEVVVGDVVVLNIGDRIPADGLFIDGQDHSLLVDESSMMSTGKSDRFVEIDAVTNPFLISGSKVIHGNYARMLVISVMTTTSHDSDDQQTTLQSLLNKLTCLISKVACLVSFINLLRIPIRYFSGNTKDDDQNGINIPFVISNIVAIAEGLSLAFTVGLMYSTKGMMDDQAIVKKLSACEAMGTATVICTHKTGTLTMNQMEVTKFRLGIDHEIEDDSTTVVAGEKVLHLFHQGVGLNTTGSVYKSGNTFEYSGSPTEKTILSWGVMNLGMKMEKLKNDYAIFHAQAFSSEKMRSGVLIRKKDDNTVHVHWKGAAETVLAMCSNYYQNTGHKMSLNHNERTHLEEVIEKMAASGLRCIAFAHKQIPAEELKHNEDKTLDEEGLTLLGIVGIKDPCRPGVKEAIVTCRAAGVHVMMITGANLYTAKAIATECGILEVGPDVSNNGVVIEGKEFRNYTEEERMDVCDKILVMARSTPSDKLLMVQCLKKQGHVVAVTGHRANDAPAMKEADIGLSMGIEGTEVAKESSDIVIVDDDFGSVVKGLSWGRCVFHNIQKFIQFQLPPNLAALAVNFISDASGKGSPLITSVQMLWVNLVMVTFGALALATDHKPTKEVMKKPPVIGAHALRITSVVWRNLLAQSLYQIIVILLIIFFNVNERVRNTIFFNTFVFCQLFNLFNSRKVEKMNVFEGVHKNKTFLGIVGLVIVLQVVMVEFLNIFVADMEKLNMKQWGICIVFASLSWPIGWFVKMIPVASSYLRSMVVDLRQSQEIRLEVDKLKMCNDARRWSKKERGGRRVKEL